MVEIHCYNCGGFITEPSRIMHRRPPSLAHKERGAIPVTALCVCEPPVVYGPPAGRSSTPSRPGVN